MSRFFGIDTSNYRTSAALFDSETMQWKNSGRLLEVPEGRIGLRQSDALFQHVLHLPARIDALEAGFGKNLRAIAASTRPRAVEGSYMPCFLAGAGQARSMAHALDVPFYEVSHQQGHLAAAALSADALDLLRQPFLAWHLSGGTTELLHVKPEGKLFSAEIVGGTDDLAAGQLIDRAGNLLHLPFPSGAQLEQLANQCEEPEKPFRPKVMDFHFSLSGAQNKIEQLHQKALMRLPSHDMRLILYLVQLSKRPNRQYKRPACRCCAQAASCPIGCCKNECAVNSGQSLPNRYCPETTPWALRSWRRF